ncbi:MAG: Fe2+-dependent dioxygenase [Burkholderiaceae bacterium]|nr:MAG: Fe2+-dependent dioxygenase [Burkholderiaceae bacterium]
MLLHIPQILAREQVSLLRQQLAQGPWEPDQLTAGPQASQVKRNLQLPAACEASVTLGLAVRQALEAHPLFVSAALPRTFMQPFFNRYEGGGTYGNHVDNAIRRDPVSGAMLRADVSCTLFLSDPDEYEGGELVIEDSYGTHEVKLEAGDAIVYPSTSLHRVEPVTAGCRWASFMFIQSLVRSDEQRRSLFELDQSIQALRAQLGDTPPVVQLTGHYHNLLRQWSEV